jgi:hypothetical protein
MTQDILVCRFCLESKGTKKNPLLEPCECRGSIRYVHQVCLTRWRRQDPSRNAELCRLCLTPYKRTIEGGFEEIPDEITIALLYLRFPILLCFTINYTFLVQLFFLKENQLYSSFEVYQFLFQAAYFGLFYSQWNVRNKRLYWDEWKHFSTAILFATHVVCSGYLYSGQYGAIIPLNVILRLYWQRHTNILLALNAQ